MDLRKIGFLETDRNNVIRGFLETDKNDVTRDFPQPCVGLNFYHIPNLKTPSFPKMSTKIPSTKKNTFNFDQDLDSNLNSGLRFQQTHYIRAS